MVDRPKIRALICQVRRAGQESPAATLLGGSNVAAGAIRPIPGIAALPSLPGQETSSYRLCAASL